MANDAKRMREDAELIRADKLFHVCSRFIAKNREIYLCDYVNFDYTTGRYYCANWECNKKLSAEDVLADCIGTGWEGHA